MTRTLSDELAALVAVVRSVPDVGVVHDYERYAADTQALRNLYTVTIAGQPQVRGWFVQRWKTIDQKAAAKAAFDRSTWRIVGFMGLKDEDASELVFMGLVESIRDALRADLTLGGVVMPPERDEHAGPAVECGPVLFAGMLCHRAEIHLTTKRFVSVP